jgi:hypothetical protein
MPTHRCIDPHDPFAQAEVLVDFEVMASGVRLISVRDASDSDTLSDLDEVHRQALESEILDVYRRLAPAQGGLARRGPTMDNQRAGQA